MPHDVTMRRVVIAGAAAVVVAAGVAAGVLLSSTSGGGPQPRARVYANVDECLLTGPQGVSAAPDSQVWQVMENVSLATSARVSYLQVEGPATSANASGFLGSLLVRGCRVVVAADAPERAAVLGEAPRFRSVRFVVVGGGSADVTGVPASLAGLRAAITSGLALPVGTARRTP
jgi:hypothetical protein